jgi:pimeloyl-ACP methyl ester carboxylesterase
VSEIEVLLQHGWGFGAACWEAWQAAAPPGVRLLAAERGYFGAPAAPAGQPRLVVAHSFGLHLLEPGWLEGAQLAVVLGGFRAFHPEGGAGRHSRRLVGRMRQRLVTEPQALLADFYTRCFAPEAGPPALTGPPDLCLLAADLERLDTSVLDLSALCALPCVLLLHGAEDQIVPVARAQDLHQLLPTSRLQVVTGAGHALPLTRAAACWAYIREVWEELSA